MKRTSNPKIEDLVRMRVLYERRGPQDGKIGLNPDGQIAPAWTINVEAAMQDAVEELGRPSLPALSRWRAALGLDPVNAVSIDEQCPNRGPALKHTQDVRINPGGECVHCGAAIRR